MPAEVLVNLKKDTDKANSVLLFLLLVLCGVAQLYLSFNQAIHWDEFYFLSRVYEFQAGTLTGVLNNFHVHFFGWLHLISDNEVVQIQMARSVMWVLQLCTLGIVYWLGREFLSRPASLFSAFCLIVSGYVMFHGASFRTDPPAVMFAMLALAILMRTNLDWKWMLLAALCLAMGFMFAIKVVLFAPAFLSAAVWRLWNSENRKLLVVRMFATAAVGVILVGAFLLFHMNGLAAAAVNETETNLADAMNTTLLGAGILPRLPTMLLGIQVALIPTLFFLAGTIFALFAIVQKGSRLRGDWILLGLASPVLCLLIYRNAFGYFFPFIFPPAILLAGYVIDRWKPSSLALTLVGVLSIGLLSAFYTSRISHSPKFQQTTIDVVHRMFPEGTRYFDRCGMISSFSREGLFFSSWGIKIYRQNGAKMFTEIMKRKVVPLLIENRAVFTTALSASGIGTEKAISKQDADLLRTNYIRHWGNIWIAGRHVEIRDVGTQFSNEVPGIFTVEAKSRIKINGKIYSPGQLVELRRGLNIVSADQPQVLTLRWGDNIYRPAVDTQQQELFPIS